MTVAAAMAILTSCGLDTYIYLYPVSQYYNSPSETDLIRNYISFPTEDVRNASTTYFKGFEIYYRIYNNKETRNSDASSITYQSTNYPATVYSYIINTKKYVRLDAATRIGQYPLIPKNAPSYANQTVKIRLTDYQDYIKCFTVDTADYGLALRTLDGESKNNNANYTFVFDEINDGDVDVTFGTFDDISDKKFYVQMFVLTYGYDEGFKPLYSEAYNIGYLTIRDD